MLLQTYLHVQISCQAQHFVNLLTRGSTSRLRVSLRAHPRAGFDPEDGVALEGPVAGVFFLFLFFSSFSPGWGLVSCTGGDSKVEFKTKRTMSRKGERGRKEEGKRQVPSYEQTSRDTPVRERGDPEFRNTPRRQRRKGGEGRGAKFSTGSNEPSTSFGRCGHVRRAKMAGCLDRCGHVQA